MLLPVLLVVSSYLGYASSQVAGVDINNLPTCAQSCITNNTASAVGCAISDIKCICSSINYINALSCCLENTCNATDQKAALAFDIALCNTYNVSIPDFLGCSPLLVTASYSTTTRLVGLTTAQATATSMNSFTIATVSTINDIASAFTAANDGPVAEFTGGLLLKGSCTTPHIASVTVAGGGVLEYPWVGCSNENPDCCPFPVNSPGPLSVCPGDYFTTSSACCPSGWSVYTSVVAGQTPCYTTPALPLVPPAATSAKKRGITPLRKRGPTTTSIISTELFTLRYTLAQPKSGLPTGAIVGIAVGGFAFLVLLGLSMFLISRARKLRARAIKEATIVRNMEATNEHDLGGEKRISILTGGGTGSTTGGIEGTTSPGNATSPASKAMSPASRFNSRGTTYPNERSPNNTDIPELPSPEPRSPQMRPVTSPLIGSPNSQTRREPVASAEMPGSTFIHEHHPAYIAPEDAFSM